jgi:hypothetical protein
VENFVKGFTIPQIPQTQHSKADITLNKVADLPRSICYTENNNEKAKDPPHKPWVFCFSSAPFAQAPLLCVSLLPFPGP